MTYSVWQSFITNGVKTISGAVVSVFHEGSGTPAALFSSPSGGSIGSSVTSDSAGLARFYVAAGVYRITVTHASFSAEHRHVRIGEMAGVDDAPSDGKQYTRKNSAWSEVTPPKPIDLRPQPVPLALSVDEISTVAPTITGLTYEADFSAGTGVSFINLSEGAANGWWIAWKPTTGVTGTGNALVFTDATLGTIAYSYVHGVGLQVQEGSSTPSTLDADFSPNDTFVIGINADGSYWFATSNVPLASFPATPPLSISSIRIAMGNGSEGEVSLSGEIIVDKDLLDSTLKGYVEASELPPYSGQAVNWPPEGVAVGDTFYVTHGGTLQGVEYTDPDENLNHEGFKVLGLPAPEESLFDLLPIKDISSYVESVEADVGYALGFTFVNANPANPANRVLTTELPGYLRPHRIGSSSEQYTELYYDSISFFRGGDYPYFTGLHPNTSGENVNVTLPAEDGTLARLEDFPTESVITYDNLLLLSPLLYPKHTFYVSDYGNVPVKATLDGSGWIAQRSFVLAAGNPVSTLTATTAETPMQEVRIPVSILGKAPLIRVHTNNASVTDGTRMLKYRLSNTSGGASGTQLYGNSPAAGAVSQAADVINVAPTVWVSSTSNASFTSDSASAEVYLKITYQLSASEASTALNTYSVYALPGNE